MKNLVPVLLVVLGAVVELNEACGGAKRQNSSSSAKNHTGSIFPTRVYTYIRTHKPNTKRICRLPNKCLEECKEGQYPLGRYGCKGGKVCCTGRPINRTTTPAPSSRQPRRVLDKRSDGRLPATIATQIPSSQQPRTVVSGTTTQVPRSQQPRTVVTTATTQVPSSQQLRRVVATATTQVPRSQQPRTVVTTATTQVPRSQQLRKVVTTATTQVPRSQQPRTVVTTATTQVPRSQQLRRVVATSGQPTVLFNVVGTSAVPTTQRKVDPFGVSVFGQIPKQQRSRKKCQADFNGICRGECNGADEFIQGKFDCQTGNCCVKRT